MGRAQFGRQGRTGKLTVTSTPQLVSPVHSRIRRISLSIQNNSEVDMFISFEPDVSNDDALVLPAGSPVVIDEYSGTVYIAVASGEEPARFGEIYE